MVALLVCSLLVPTLVLHQPALILHGASVPAPPLLARAPHPSAALASYAAEAAGLFGNMQGTAAFLAGGLVPMASFAKPEIEAADSSATKRLKRAHLFLACVSLISELLAVIVATVAKNTLVEATVPATVSLKALLFETEFALPWVSVNVHFLLGLFGFVGTVALNAFISFGGACCVGPALTCGVASALLLMVSFVNRAVVAGSAHAGGSMLGLVGRYTSLLLAEVFVGRKVLVGLALAFGVAAAVLTVLSLSRSE